jgi:serine phosphatase RsbU (regulator of sigma subunit)
VLRDHPEDVGSAPAGSERLAADTRFLLDVSDLLSKASSRPALTKEFAEAVSRRFCDVCAVHVIDREGSLTLEAAADRRPTSAAQRAFSFKDGFVRDAMRSRRAVRYARVRTAESPAHGEVLQFLRVSACRSLIVAPVSIGPTCVGAVSFAESGRPHPFAETEAEFAAAIARQLGLALENADLRERELQVARRARFIARAADDLLSTLDRTEMFQQMLNVIVDEFADWASVMSPEENEIYAVASALSGMEAPFGGSEARFVRSTERRLRTALREHRALLINEIARSPVTRSGLTLKEIAPHSWIMAPVFVAGKTYGAIVCYSERHRYSQADLDVLEELARRVSIALEHFESFARERRLVQTLQQATLPTNLAHVERATVSVCYSPAAIEERVGGDWYDVSELDDHRVLLTVGDVTGHGLEASVIMGKLRHSINAVAMYETEPSYILDAAERIVLRRFPDAIATAFVAILDSRRNTLSYASAGHPCPMIRLRDGTVRQLAASGLPIGLRKMTRPESSVCDDLDADLLVLYTDGLTEAGRDPVAGERCLADALTRDAVKFVHSPADFLKTLCVGDRAPDDVALLILNFVTLDRWTFASDDRKTAQGTRRAVVARLRQLGGPQEWEPAELILGELIANVTRHAPGQADLALEWSGDHPVLHVIDRGSGYSAEFESPADLLSESGRGLWLIKALGAHLSVTPIPGFGTHTRVVLPVRELNLAAAANGRTLAPSR